MRPEAESEERDRRTLLIVWTLLVISVCVLGSGMSGSVEITAPRSLGEALSWAIPLSPIIPLVLWLRARKALRDDW
jgi:hypothetical protein